MGPISHLFCYKREEEKKSKNQCWEKNFLTAVIFSTATKRSGACQASGEPTDNVAAEKQSLLPGSDTWLHFLTFR